MNWLVTGAHSVSGEEIRLEIEADSQQQAAEFARTRGLYPYSVTKHPSSVVFEPLDKVTRESDPVTTEVKRVGMAMLAAFTVMIGGYMLVTNWLRGSGGGAWHPTASSSTSTDLTPSTSMDLTPSNTGGSAWHRTAPSGYEQELRRQSDQHGYSMESLEHGVQRARAHGVMGTDENLLRISVEGHKLEEALRNP